MPDVHLISYGDRPYRANLRHLESQSKKVGWFKSFKAYQPADLDSDFRRKYHDILSQRRGGGYFIWKPYILLQRMNQLPDGDILVYLDSGCFINHHAASRFKQYLAMLEDHSLIVFQLTHEERVWTTEQVLTHLGFSQTSPEARSYQCIGGIIILKVDQRSREIVQRWLDVLDEDAKLFTDYYNKQQSAYFRDHRHDQSIYSVINKQYNYAKFLPDETFLADPRQLINYPFWATRLKLPDKSLGPPITASKLIARYMK